MQPLAQLDKVICGGNFQLTCGRWGHLAEVFAI